MLDFLRSEQSNERRAFEGNANPLLRARMMELLKSLLPEESRPPRFADALRGGHFDSGNLNVLIEMMRRRHAPPESIDRAASAMGGGGVL